MKFLLLCGIFLLSTGKGGTSPIVMSLNTMNLFFQADPYGNCPSGYTQPANSNLTSCYKIYTYFTTSKNAANQCKKDNGTLASIPNDFVNTYLYYLATRADATALWLGIECFNGDTSTCQNDDRTEFRYSNFKTASCQSNPLDSCVSMSTIGRDSQEWSTLDCRQRLNFACKVTIEANETTAVHTTVPRHTSTPIPKTSRSIPKTSTPIPKTSRSIPKTSTPIPKTSRPIPTRPPSCPKDYTVFQGMCYRFVGLGERISSNVASDLCGKIPGGQLAIIASAELNEFLTNLEKKTTTVHWPTTAFGLRCPTVAFKGDKSSCLWNDGTPFAYNNFGQGNPSQNNGCCDFYSGSWANCFSCYLDIFQAYICQAPLINKP